MTKITEFFLPIKGYEGLYEISNYGNVKSVAKPSKIKLRGYSERILKPSNHSKYNRVVLQNNSNKNTVLVHRLVAETFISNPENKPFVNHINGIKTDNRLENLEWCTPLENTTHAFANGLCSKSGENNSMSILTSNDVFEIRELLKKDITQTKISKKFGVSISTINHIKSGKRWAITG